jgi:hypothetical protein
MVSPMAMLRELRRRDASCRGDGVLSDCGVEKAWMGRRFMAFRRPVPEVCRAGTLHRW